MLQNILTTIKDLTPGDTWTEDYMHYVVYNTVTENYQTTVYYVACDTRDKETRKGKFTMSSNTRFVANR